ncbi:MAG TPA: periplasmic heavy metal sensor [Candidatus Aquilonibacter sp.]|nr:periplasmic heavy metal sensor [Candidatus Aquilonibacter sp.]
MRQLFHGRPGSVSLLLQAALALAVLWSPRIAIAQHHGGGGPGGGFGGGMPGGMGEGMGDRGGFARPSPDIDRGGPRGMHGGLQVGPPFRWWDDKHYVKQLKLTEDQQRHMDAIFEQNKGTLVKRFEAVQQEEQHMEALTHAKTLDESALFAQIDRIEQARADLAKATTHYMVQLHNELSQDQISKLANQQ